MTQDLLLESAVLLLSGTAGALVWAVRTLWRLDRRMVRVETKLGLIDERTV